MIGKILNNDFKKWHFGFMTMYLLTYIVGLLRGTNSFFYKIHPVVGIASVVVPLVLYILLKNKKMIRVVIKSNFNLKGSVPIKFAKGSTMIILVYYVFSILSGFLLNNSLYNSIEMYNALSAIHGIAKFIVPIAVVTHVVSRLYIKKRKTKKKVAK